MPGELPLLWIACLGYVAAAFAAWRRPDAGRALLLLLAGALAVHTAAIAVRWVRVGHGPFTTMYEILSSNVWSLALVYAVAAACVPALRATARVVLPVLLMMAAWMLAVDAGPGHFPATYTTSLLYIHTLFGKLFLGLALVAVGLAGIVVARRWRPGVAAALPACARLDELAYRFLAAAFAFETLMLIVGAIWAQDAWGRYWAWDPLETWAFLTWLAAAFALHLRAARRPPPAVAAGLILAVFTLAFLTFFGVPFVSTSPHKGAV